MISFCIKTNNQSDILKLTNYISEIQLDNIVFLTKNFSKYTNIIVHYLGNDTEIFYEYFANTLCDFIIDNYESNILNDILVSNFFYFDKTELSEIKKICDSMLNNVPLNKILPFQQLKSETANDEKISISSRKDLLINNILSYLKSSKSMILNGFLRFRIYDYINFLNDLVDSAVNEFVINKEYSEFIELLKLYIDSKPPRSELIHLIYINEESILLDKNRNIISLSHNNLDIPYLSDISFSSNDYALNSLLSLLPKKLIIHTSDIEDDFVNTLKLIFNSKVTICKHCSICDTYKLVESKKEKNRKSLNI